jgi:hypothetical protein
MANGHWLLPTNLSIHYQYNERFGKKINVQSLLSNICNFHDKESIKDVEP